MLLETIFLVVENVFYNQLLSKTILAASDNIYIYSEFMAGQ